MRTRRGALLRLLVVALVVAVALSAGAVWLVDLVRDAITARIPMAGDPMP
ncbi:putative membrane protein [Thermocatellispora tengchongensis]|uniref:Putative membrane protein n=1 Tax=Thermocatellispora tengchongensis TaxID=1073253 RepID=A0A840P3S1_9ACTN|nr:hypothetical protein [Thermocatellispora tengchongensis]MBB5133629.1 putative membrane protein [Thermocatellispora tengchongensis]